MQKVHILGGRAGQIIPWLLPLIGRGHEAGRPVLLLVPEQYTLQAERELVEGLHLPGMLSMEVLSPRRLMSRVRERAGSSGLAPLDERGRCMALRQALQHCGAELSYYRSVAEQPGLPARLSALLADMEKAGMTPEVLREHAERLPEGATRAKEHDLALIWAAYRELMAGRFADEIDQQLETAARVRRSGVVRGADVYVYGFDVLPQTMLELLCEVARDAASLTVTLVMDAADAPDGRLFMTQRNAAMGLMQRLELEGIPSDLRYLPRRTLERDPALTHLERYLFSREEVPFEGAGDAISVHEAANPYAEASYAAQQLRAWHEQGIPWGAMAVALAGDELLAGTLAVTLQASGIPHYIARKDSALRHGLCRLLVSAARAAANGYAAQDVLSVAKSGFSPLTDGEAMLLENYAVENGINRGKWLRPFTRGADAGKLEPLRQRLMAPLVAFHDRLRDARSATASMETVFRLLEDVGAYDALMRREQALLERGMQAEAAQNRQVWALIMGLLDQLHGLLGEKRAALKDVAGYLEAGLTSSAISALPPEPDTVMIGEAGHLMTGELDALILMGMQDGVTAGGMDSLLTERERAALTEAVHRPVGMTRAEQNALRQSDFYRTMALPRRRLLLTWSAGSQDGAAMRCAGLIDDLKRLFPAMPVTGGVTADGRGDAPLSPETALEGLALRLRDVADGRSTGLDARWQEALRYLWQSERWHDRTRMLVDSLSARVEAGTLTGAQTKRLFTQDTVSISRLEEFASCPYRHFVDYGLKPVARRDFAFQPDERGNFFHEALQRYATLASALPEWPQVDDDTIDRLVDQALTPLTDAWESGPLREDAMGRSLGEEYIRSVRRSAWMFTRHARNSRFTTVGAEVRFGEEGGLPPVILTLKDGRRVALRGTIDRIDRFEGDRGVYLRVVDYKSSQRTLEPVRMWYGLQLQLLLYLKAAEQSVPGALPAGAFYFTVQDPMVTSPQDIKAEAERLIAREMRLRGVVLAETEVVEAMDADLPEYSLGKVFNKDGSVARTAQAYDLDAMHGLLNHAARTAADLADGIRSGCIDIAPAQIDQWSACTWCPYAGICGRDTSRPGGEPRVLEAEDRETLMRKMTRGDQPRDADENP